MIKVTLGAAETQEEKPFPKLMKSLIDGMVDYNELITIQNA